MSRALVPSSLSVRTVRHCRSIKKHTAVAKITSNLATSTQLSSTMLERTYSQFLTISACASFSSFPSLSSSSSSDLSSSLSISGILNGDRSQLSRAITLMESTRTDHRHEATEVLAKVLKEKPIKAGSTFRVGISGPPGVGKSTMIEALGVYLCSEGHRVAVLSIDPSSSRTGGSILGDKTRMAELARHPNAYVRPSPSRCKLGGVTQATSDAITLCEAGGYDVVLVETVGVGQSETAVRDIVDCMMLLVQPGGGDELQGIKKGIVELCDLVVVTKADGKQLDLARHTKVEYMHALQLIRAEPQIWVPKVGLYSSQASHGTSPYAADKVWAMVEAHHEWLQQGSGLSLLRIQQQKTIMRKLVEHDLADSLLRDDSMKRLYEKFEKLSESTSPRVASTKFVDEICRLAANAEKL